MTVLAAAAMQPVTHVALITAAALVMISAGVRRRRLTWRPRRDLREQMRHWREALRGHRY